MNVAYSKDALISSEISFDVIRKFRTFHLIERSPETPVIVWCLWGTHRLHQFHSALFSYVFNE